MHNQIINRAADNIRILSAAMVEKAKSGHPGGAMGGADFINLLYTEFLRYDPSDLGWHMRDRFFLDPGHMSPMLYSVLALCGNYTIDEFKNFRQGAAPPPAIPNWMSVAAWKTPPGRWARAMPVPWVPPLRNAFSVRALANGCRTRRLPLSRMGACRKKSRRGRAGSRGFSA